VKDELSRTPVPLGIAAVIVTTFRFSAPSSVSPLPNTAV
jgi:hypothetical protein